MGNYNEGGGSMKARKKPVLIDTWQWLGEDEADAREFCVENDLPEMHVGEVFGKTGLVIHTLEGDHLAIPGDWIIKGVEGEYYPCKPDIFNKTYELMF